jgi:hypothetical protein
MSTPTCHHVLANGALCQAVPLRNRDYCRFHLQQIGRRMKAARARAHHQRPMLKLPLLEDLYSVQIAFMQLGDALTYQEIDPVYARLLTTVLRLAMQNLKSKQSWDRSQRFQLSASPESTPTTWDTFEQEHDLPADLDLGMDPEVAFPPGREDTTAGPDLPGVGLSSAPGVAGAQYIRGRGVCDREGEPIDPSATLNGGPDVPCLVTPEMVEIIDVREREGKEAMYKVIAQQERNRKRRGRHIRRLYYEEVARNHSIKMSAEKLSEDRRKAEAAAARTQAASTQKPPEKSAAEKAYEAALERAADMNRKPPQSEAPCEPQAAVAKA